MRNVWFKHDGVPAHKTSRVKQYLVTEFGNQIIGYGGFEEWPPRLRDLTPLDFFLKHYLKQQGYVASPQTLQYLKRRITDACANVSSSMLQCMPCEIQTRIQMCIAADGAKIEHLKERYIILNNCFLLSLMVCSKSRESRKYRCTFQSFCFSHPPQ